MVLTEVSSAKSFEGLQKVYSHDSKELQCKMKFSAYLPPKAVAGEKLPVLYWLSGLTCTEENFMIKSGFQRYASENNIIVVGPDTSPRGVNIEGQDESWDFGSGAGFYVDATEPKWAKHYRMYSYVTKELPKLVEAELPVLPNRRSISGHSMGGHGALICSLKNPGMYKSVSAFAPISNPSECPWGIKAFTGYLGAKKETWKNYDATHLVTKYAGPKLEILIDTGDADQWYKQKQLLPENLIKAAQSSSNVKINHRFRPGYDHGYFFVGTFIEDHIKYHAKALRS